MGFTGEDTPFIASLDLIAEHAASIWSDCPTEGTHLLFRIDEAGGAAHLRMVRRVGRGYVLAEHGPEFDVEDWVNTPGCPGTSWTKSWRSSSGRRRDPWHSPASRGLVEAGPQAPRRPGGAGCRARLRGAHGGREP